MHFKIPKHRNLPPLHLGLLQAVTILFSFWDMLYGLLLCSYDVWQLSLVNYAKPDQVNTN